MVDAVATQRAYESLVSKLTRKWSDLSWQPSPQTIEGIRAALADKDNQLTSEVRDTANVALSRTIQTMPPTLCSAMNPLRKGWGTRRHCLGHPAALRSYRGPPGTQPRIHAAKMMKAVMTTPPAVQK